MFCRTVDCVALCSDKYCIYTNDTGSNLYDLCRI